MAVAMQGMLEAIVRRQLRVVTRQDPTYAARMAGAPSLKGLMRKNEFDKETPAFIRDGVVSDMEAPVDHRHHLLEWRLP
jgi:hypothetical protein